MQFWKGLRALALTTLVSFTLLCTTTDCRVNQSPRQVESPGLEVQENKLTSDVYLDDKFSSIERKLVIEGLHEWERASNGVIKFNIKKYGTWNSDKEIWSSAPDFASGKLKCTKDIYIARVFSQDKIVLTIQDQIKKQNPSIKEYYLAGYCNQECNVKWIIIVADRINDTKEYVAVTTHEMGHMLGLQHLSIKNETAMYPGLNYGTACLTDLDMEQFCRLWKCDPKKMKPCDPEQ